MHDLIGYLNVVAISSTMPEEGLPTESEGGVWADSKYLHQSISILKMYHIISEQYLFTAGGLANVNYTTRKIVYMYIRTYLHSMQGLTFL